MGWKKSKNHSDTEPNQADMLPSFTDNDDDSCRDEEYDDSDANYWLGEYFWSEPSVQNQNEYRQFKLLTLLRLLGIKTASKALEDFSWD